ncbi:Uncharacterized protein QTN25_000147 [Entamoeba marina]
MQTKQAKKKMDSTNSLILRELVLSRILHNNFQYSFVYNNIRRAPKKGLYHFDINTIYNENMEIIFNCNQANLKGKELKRYNQTKALHCMKECLESYGYEFTLITTKQTTKRTVGIEKMTNEKIRNFSWIGDDGLKYLFNMNDAENAIGIPLMEWLKDNFSSTTQHIILTNPLNTYMIINDLNNWYGIGNNVPLYENNLLVECCFCPFTVTGEYCNFTPSNSSICPSQQSVAQTTFTEENPSGEHGKIPTTEELIDLLNEMPTIQNYM